MDIKNLEDFRNLVNSCRKLGVKSLKDGEFSIELTAEALFPESDYKKKKAQKEPSIPEQSPSDAIAAAEYVMFYSSDQSLPGVSQ